jgi:hypothetical protein
MISIAHPAPYVVSVAVFNEFTLQDFQQFESDVISTLQYHERVALLFDVRDMLSYTVDVAWEEIKFTRTHAHEFSRIALVTTDQWLTWAAWLERFWLNTEIRVFDAPEPALAWLSASLPE